MRTHHLLITIVILMITLTYASVPLYQLFCQITGYGGTTQVALEIPQMVNDSKVITIHFSSNVSDELGWYFKPMVNKMDIIVGEPSLTFYEATNPTDETIIGVATYNVAPPQAGLYFNKIQCFCFEEQALNGQERIEMPVLFFIDPEIVNDPNLIDVNDITLSYTFFRKS